MDDQENQKLNKYRALLENAAKGELKAQFQLGKEYLTGTNIDKNLEKSEEYFKDVVKKACEFAPKIDHLNLFEFRQFKSEKIKFDSKTTVFVGNNGSGKTSIIEAISLSLSWLSALIKNEDGSGHRMKEADINNSSLAKYSSICTSLSVLPNLNYEITLVESKEGVVNKQRSKYMDIKQLAEIYRYCNEKNENFGLPVLAYYSISRSVEVKMEDFEYAAKKDAKASWGKLDGYTESLDESKSFRQFLAWLIRVDKVEEETSSSQFIALQSKIENTRELIELLSQNKNESNTEISLNLISRVQDMEEQLSSMKSAHSSIEVNEINLSKKVKEAIYKFMPSVKNIRIKYTLNSIDLVMDKNGVTISALQLSQGEKSLFSLVGDIARRMVMLNPSLKANPLDGHGIILIDEIDLHLHPMWQQQVVRRLNKTFKNIQFILSTHSPQVLSTVSHESIRIISDIDGNIEIITPDFSLGSESKQILEDILGVPSRPQDVQIVKDLSEYEDLVSQDSWDSPRALELRDKLGRWSQQNDPIILKLDMDVRLRKRRRDKAQNEKDN